MQLDNVIFTLCQNTFFNHEYLSFLFLFLLRLRLKNNLWLKFLCSGFLGHLDTLLDIPKMLFYIWVP